ncbi:MAG TPA: cupin domain-containing protein [Chitinophagales bacterium]|nr:cupin domain-containing protein [Chitinophagales bacterium]
MKKLTLATIAVTILFFACRQPNTPVTTSATNAKDLTKETYSLAKLVDENKYPPDSAMQLLHAQHHPHKMLEGRKLPSPFTAPSMKHYTDYAVKFDDLPVINPGPGEYVHVMEGQRHGYQNLTIGITETYPGGAPPMHTHDGEESHVLLSGDTILYALGDTLFTITGPYIVNIPPMVPHAFKNISSKTANLVVIFPTNVWKYDVLDYFPFDEKNKSAEAQSHSHESHDHSDGSHSHPH